MSININSTQVSAALALLPMFIPGWRPAVLPAGVYHGGIPLSIHSPFINLYMVIDPVTTLSTTLAAGDSVELWVNGKPTSVIVIIKKGEENDRIEMELPWGWLVNGLNQLFYRVTRPSGNSEDSTPVLDVLFNYPGPGVIVSHPASVGPAQPATFTFTRSYAREYDEMTLTVGTWSKTIPYVHPANPITYTLTAADLQQIGDGTHPVSATVVDQLGNRNVSTTTSIAISANQRVLNPPIIVEAEANNRVLSVAALGGNNATIHALTWTGMKDKQACWMRVASFKADGSAHDLQIWNGLPAATNPIWISQGKYVQTLLNNYLAALGDGKPLKVLFWVSLDGSNSFTTATPFPDQVYSVQSLVVVTPTIDSVTTEPGDVEIPHNGPTIATSVNVTGTASKSQRIEILVNGQSRATLTTKPDGSFSTILSDFEYDVRTDIQVRALYGDYPVSLIRSFFVHEALQIDQQPMTLSGFSVKIFIWPRTGRESVGNTATRQPTGGVPQYRYKSLNPAIASVDETGHVTGNRNGSTTIVVTDSLGNTAQYNVNISNVWTLQVNNNRMSSAASVAWMQSIGGQPIPTSGFILDAYNCYYAPVPRAEEYWACYITSPAANWVLQQTQYSYGLRYDDIQIGAWCITPY